MKYGNVGDLAELDLAVKPRRRLDMNAVPACDLTLMAVHAHPDDESTSTGGILALFSSEGAHTIVVTCANGGLGMC